MMYVVLFLSLLACLDSVYGIHDASILNLYHHQTTGDGTYYGNTKGGVCSLNVPNLPAVASRVDKLVALNSHQMFGSSACGMCFQVHGTGHGLGNDPITGTFIVYVKDVCPECQAGSVDLAENGDGRWKVNIKAVQCPVGNTKIEYRFEGSNPWYMKLQVRNERMPSTTVEMYQPIAGRWITLHRTADGFWTLGAGAEKPVKLPFKVRLHAPNGQTLEDTVHATDMGSTNIIHGNGVQFPLDHTLPSA